MWSTLLILQAVGWLVLILSVPLIISFTRKVARHAAYRLFPKDLIIQYQDGNEVTEAYLIQQSLFKKAQFRRLTDNEIRNLEAIR